MLHPLEQKLVELRRRVRPMALLHGLCIVATALLGAMVAVGSARLSVSLSGSRPADHRVAVRAGASADGPSTAMCSRCLRMRLGNVELARRVQRQFPVPGRSTRHRRRVSAHGRRRSGGRLSRPAADGDCPGDGGSRSARFFAHARPASRASRRHGDGSRVRGGRRLPVARAQSAAAQIALHAPAEPFRQHALAADDQSGHPPAGRAGRPRAELRDRSDRRPRRPASARSAHPLSAADARRRNDRGNRTDACRRRRGGRASGRTSCGRSPSASKAATTSPPSPGPTWTWSSRRPSSRSRSA